MILQELTNYYNACVAEGLVPPRGWEQVGISVDVHLNPDGSVRRFVNVQHDEKRGKKTVQRPNMLVMPAGEVSTVNIAANFLWHNADYLLGIPTKGNPERTKRCFAASRELHEKVLGNIDSKAAQSIRAFFNTWNPDTFSEVEGALAVIPLLEKGANLTFCDVEGTRIAEDEDIRTAWTTYYSGKQEGPEEVCLVTGMHTEHIAVTHPKIKGVAGAQSTGASLVSFNAPAFCSYGREQNANAPISHEAAFAYTTALNYLLAHPSHVMHIGIDTVVMWAQSAQTAYPDFMSAIWNPDERYSEGELRSMLQRISRGESVDFDGKLLDSEMPFYILGLSPNAGRISVRFFLQNTFGAFIRNLNEHQENLRIVGYDHAEDKMIPVWKLLSATVNQNSKDKKPLPQLSGNLMTSILNGMRYPTTLLTGVNLRIRAERSIDHTKAAILKAYYTRNTNPQVPREILKMNLNKESNNIPYLLGRLFSIYESIQQQANPGIKATITAKYFTSAASTPAIVFPVLGDLAQKHLRKLKGNPSKTGLAIYLEQQIVDLGSRLGEQYPVRLSLPEQGSFQLGYYAQTQERYAKKNQKDETAGKAPTKL